MKNIENSLLKAYADSEEFPLVICSMDFRIRYINKLAAEK